MIYPQLLKEGDCIALVATARKVNEEEVNPAIKLLQQWGFKVKIPQGLFAEDNQFAGDDEHRYKILQQELDDEEIKAIWCVRGGYGTVRIIDKLNFDKFKAHPKWIIGYSDITVLHSHIQQNHGIATLHATMPLNISEADLIKQPASISSLHQALTEGVLKYEFKPHPLNREGIAAGEIIGGNLSILYSLCGSESDINTDGKILMIEDLDEYLYHIDRMMQNLKRTDKLTNLKGLIVGAMSDMHDNTIPFGQTAEEIIWDAVKEYNYPVCFNAKFGHIGIENLALPMGITATMEVEKEDYCRLKIGEK